jgi:putative SOS response-associated peptidase YedK
VLARAGTAPPAQGTCWVQFDDWMRGTPDQAAALMKPYGGAIEAWEVRAKVGNVRNNRPELLERVVLL